MLNIFKKRPVSKDAGYPAVVEEIHNLFNSTGERLVKEAREIIAEAIVINENKIHALKKYGFGNASEVKQADTAHNKKLELQQLTEALEYFGTRYPGYKFITPEAALGICHKYDLVIGGVSQYKGFVPVKNLTEIDKFFQDENELNTRYTKYISGDFGRSNSRECSKDEYDRQESAKSAAAAEASADHYQIRFHSNEIHKDRVTLQIAAPLKDMEQVGYKVKNQMLVREVPDPVVLAPVQYKGVELYCIVTAWGDEASDEVVVNQKMN
jgi:hypothetical protein